MKDNSLGKMDCFMTVLLHSVLPETVDIILFNSNVAKGTKIFYVTPDQASYGKRIPCEYNHVDKSCHLSITWLKYTCKYTPGTKDTM